MAPHVAVSGIVQNVICMTSTKQIEKVQPALRWPRTEPCEPVIADLRAKSILPGMARARVVGGHERRGCKPGTQNILGFREEVIVLFRQQPLHLTLRDRHTQRSQQ